MLYYEIVDLQATNGVSIINLSVPRSTGHDVILHIYACYACYAFYARAQGECQ